MAVIVASNYFQPTYDALLVGQMVRLPVNLECVGVVEHQFTLRTLLRVILDLIGKKSENMKEEAGVG